MMFPWGGLSPPSKCVSRLHARACRARHGRCRERWFAGITHLLLKTSLVASMKRDEVGRHGRAGIQSKLALLPMTKPLLRPMSQLLAAYVTTLLLLYEH